MDMSRKIYNFMVKFHHEGENYMYKKNMMREYIKSSELRIFNDRIKVRLSKELAVKYDNGCYYSYLNNMDKCFQMIDTLNIQYPSNAHPIFYVYIVPDDNYAELLNFPAIFDRGKGGGKPVRCYDLDGFTSAYGLSQNMLENKPSEETNISKIENEIHELAHIVHSQFFNRNQIICEGFAEALPLYALGFEEIFDEHRNSIINLSGDQVLNAQEILNSEKDNSYGSESILPNRSCSFRLSYISSYLFVRGCMETIAKKYNLSKEQSVQHFLEIVKESDCSNEWLIYDIADALDFPRDELLNGKQMQLEILQSLSIEAPQSKLTK